MIKLMLNKQKFNNYAFFCPVSKLHVTVSNPVGYVNEVTPAILRAIKLSTLIDVDGVIDIETGTVKDAQSVNTPVQKTSENLENNNTDVEQLEEVAEVLTSNEAPKAKKGRGKPKEATDTDEKSNN